MPAGILEVIGKEKPAAGLVSAAGLGIVLRF